MGRQRLSVPFNDDQRIAQLIVVRAHSNLGPDHVAGSPTISAGIMSAPFVFPGRAGTPGQPHQLYQRYRGYPS